MLTSDPTVRLVASRATTETPLGTLERGLAILELFNAEKPEWTFRELSDESGLAKATTRRLVLTLERLGWLEQIVDSGSFVLGPQILRSLYAKNSTSMLVRESRPYLEQLARATTETAMLAAWGHDGPITLDLVSTPRHFKPFTSVGMVMQGLETADAQILIAFSPEAVWDTRFDAIIAQSQTLTERDRNRVRESWERVREAGIAYDREQWRQGVCAVAAPVLDASGHALASISIVLPSERADDAAMNAGAAAILAASITLSEQYGNTTRATP